MPNSFRWLGVRTPSPRWHSSNVLQRTSSRHFSCQRGGGRLSATSSPHRIHETCALSHDCHRQTLQLSHRRWLRSWFTRDAKKAGEESPIYQSVQSSSAELRKEVNVDADYTGDSTMEYDSVRDKTQSANLDKSSKSGKLRKDGDSSAAGKKKRKKSSKSSSKDHTEDVARGGALGSSAISPETSETDDQSGYGKSEEPYAKSHNFGDRSDAAQSSSSGAQPAGGTFDPSEYLFEPPVFDDDLQDYSVGGTRTTGDSGDPELDFKYIRVTEKTKRGRRMNKVCPSRVWSWGWGCHGALGHGSYVDVHTPRPIRICDDMALATARQSKALDEAFLRGDSSATIHPISGASVVDIETGWAQSMMIDGTGKVWRWGWIDDIKTIYTSSNLKNNGPDVLNAMQRFAETTRLGWVFHDSGTKEPSLVMDLKDLTIVKIRCSAATNFCLSNDGKVYSWGTGRWGQLGHKIGNYITEEFQRPVVIERLLGHRIIDMDTGYCHSLFLDDTGCLWTCGNGQNGRLGLGVSSRMTEIALPRPMTPLWKGYLKTQYLKREKFKFITDNPAAVRSLIKHNRFKALGVGLNDDHQEGKVLEVEEDEKMSMLGKGTSSKVGEVAEYDPKSAKGKDEKGHDITLYDEFDVKVFYDERKVQDVREGRARFDRKKGEVVYDEDEEEDHDDTDEKEFQWDDELGMKGKKGKKAKKTEDGLSPKDDDDYASGPLVRAADIVGYDLPETYKVSCGHKHSVLLTRDGQVFCYGGGNCGALGQGPRDFTDKYWPSRVLAGGVGEKFIIDIAAGQNHTVALASDGTIFTWGMGRHGQCGRNREQAFMLEDVRERGANLASVRHRAPYALEDDDIAPPPLMLITDLPDTHAKEGWLRRPDDRSRDIERQREARERVIARRREQYLAAGYDEEEAQAKAEAFAPSERSGSGGVGGEVHEYEEGEASPFAFGVDQDDGLLLKGDPLALSPGRIQNFPANLRPWRVFAGFYQTTIVTECGKAVIYGDELQRLENVCMPVILELPQKVVKMSHGWKHHLALTVNDEQFDAVLTKDLNERESFSRGVAAMKRRQREGLDY